MAEDEPLGEPEGEPKGWSSDQSSGSNNSLGIGATHSISSLRRDLANAKRLLDEKESQIAHVIELQGLDCQRQIQEATLRFDHVRASMERRIKLLESRIPTLPLLASSSNLGDHHFSQPPHAVAPQTRWPRRDLLPSSEGDHIPVRLSAWRPHPGVDTGTARNVHCQTDCNMWEWRLDRESLGGNVVSERSALYGIKLRI